MTSFIPNFEKNHCNKQNDTVLQKHLMKSCKVVLEDVCSLSGAEKLKITTSTSVSSHKSKLCHTEKNKLQNLDEKAPILWGKMNDKRWSDLDSAVHSKLKACTNLSISEKVKTLETLIYEEASKIFGCRSQIKQKTLPEKNVLLAQIASSTIKEELTALQELLQQVRIKIRVMRRGEKRRRRKWSFKNAQKVFRNDPYKAGKDLLNPKSDIRLCVEQSVLDNHKLSSLSDNFHDSSLPLLPGLPPPPQIKKAFSATSFKFSDFASVLYTRRNASAPGLNGISYKVYKKCTKISSFLFNVFKCCLKNCVVPLQWRHAKEIYIPKSKTPVPSNLKDFRPIALLNVEGKLFFSIFSRRLETHVIHNNKFINTSVQKGCMANVPGCWEHMSSIWAALKDARSARTDLATIWLDIASAYPSIPHRLIFFALERYGISPSWIAIVKGYYSGLYSKSFSKSAPTNWHQHFRGIFAGCTLSIVLFLSGINVILEYTLATSVSCYITSNRVSLPLIRAFMDDINIMSSSVAGTQVLLNRCTTALSWANMTFRAEKSRSFVIIKGRSINSTPFSVSSPENDIDFSQYIPSIHASPVRFLGRIIDCSISDRKSINELEEKLIEGLGVINKSLYTGAQKLWILQHLLIPRIQWPLLIYEVSMSVAGRLEQKVSVFIRKWLNLHRPITNISLYADSSPCPLPIKSLTSILKSAKISGHLLLRHSKDPILSTLDPSLKAGSWKVSDAVNIAEGELKYKTIRGPVQRGRTGLGICKVEVIPPFNEFAQSTCPLFSRTLFRKSKIYDAHGRNPIEQKNVTPFPKLRYLSGLKKIFPTINFVSKERAGKQILKDDVRFILSHYLMLKLYTA
ncbi:uncharacterized protein LOC130629774 [Hydractinia symbiolongicarpus]|uniref:uncharacterized protein LOC130629774 n=1 Tax=Hydractinia symbiolongicarpus TaxID=13093 RepID=UPI00254E79F4|nr:uncharacterized protein LOC130629774 [Hydractinia symbiolongicarpus]